MNQQFRSFLIISQCSLVGEVSAESESDRSSTMTKPTLRNFLKCHAVSEKYGVIRIQLKTKLHHSKGLVHLFLDS